MDMPSIQLLLVEDNPTDVLLLQDTLIAAQSVPFQVRHVERLDEAAQQLTAQHFDVVLLDLSLPDSLGLETFTALHARGRDIPIVVLTGLDDEALAVQAVQAGAQDYLVKEQISGDILRRALRYAIERHRRLSHLRAVSLIDDLTGLYNRRGFLTFAEQQLRHAPRQQWGCGLFFLDLDGMKHINDTFGHQAGDQALLDVAQIARETFRLTDIIARLGGDEFVALALDTNPSAIAGLIARLQHNVRVHNARCAHGYALSLSVGSAAYDPTSPCTIEELLAQADVSMYVQKRSKVRSRETA